MRQFYFLYCHPTPPTFVVQFVAIFPWQEEHDIKRSDMEWLRVEGWNNVKKIRQDSKVFLILRIQILKCTFTECWVHLVQIAICIKEKKISKEKLNHFFFYFYRKRYLGFCFCNSSMLFLNFVFFIPPHFKNPKNTAHIHTLSWITETFRHLHILKFLGKSVRDSNEWMCKVDYVV